MIYGFFGQKKQIIKKGNVFAIRVRDRFVFVFITVRKIGSYILFFFFCTLGFWLSFSFFFILVLVSFYLFKFHNKNYIKKQKGNFKKSLTQSRYHLDPREFVISYVQIHILYSAQRKKIIAKIVVKNEQGTFTFLKGKENTMILMKIKIIGSR